MKLRFQVTIVGRRILKLAAALYVTTWWCDSMVHTEIFPNWGCHWSQDQVGAHRRHNTTPVVTGWSRVSYLGNFVRHGPYTVTSSLWTRVLPTRLLILWLFLFSCVGCDDHYNTFNAITASGVLASGDNLSIQLFTLLECSK